MELLSLPKYNSLNIYPNPISEDCIVEFESTESGLTTLNLSDITGKMIAQTQKMLQQGTHKFIVSGLSKGVYTIAIRSEMYFYSGELISIGTEMGNCKIYFLSSNFKSLAKSKIKSSNSIVQMQYNEGEQLLITCFSNIYSTIIPLIPDQSMTVTANFIPATDADGNHYPTVNIGEQVWMAKNLKVGIMINGVEAQTNDTIIEKYCYENNPINCNIYGGIYRWNEAMQYTNQQGCRGICPVGWHLPTYDEFTVLTTFLGGTRVAGGKMKTTGDLYAGTGLWLNSNTGATNSSGFSGLPGGHILYWGYFQDLSLDGYWWSSTEHSTYEAFDCFLMNTSESVGVGYTLDKDYGLSVRCIKD
jgi:uncharacterized protein (TIGR02145 family)